jgi:SulP family sulfate permease
MTQKPPIPAVFSHFMKTFHQIFDAVSARFQPALLSVFKEKYTFHKLTQDLLAGLIVAVVALPLAIAFGIASGVSPQQGLITAVVAGFLISFFSDSHVQIGGPTGAFIVIIYGIIQQYGYDGLAVATILAGIMLILMGAFGFGTIIKYIPYPVTVGFTSGIALIIFTGQLKDILGLDIEKVPADFVEKIESYYHNIHTISLYDISISVGTILICVFWKRVTAKLPGSLVAVIVMTVIVSVSRHYGFLTTEIIQTIGDRFPDVSKGMSIPMPHWPSCSYETFRAMMSPAISIALLAGIESLLSAVVADGMTGKRHHSNTELIGQGIANLCSPLFGGIPATGAIARTATNIKNGGVSPISGIVHAVILVLIMLFLGRFASLIPMAALGGIVAVVAYNMSERHSFVAMFHSTRSDTAVMVITFLLTVFIDLVVAIQAGILLAVFLFIRRASETMVTKRVTPRTDEKDFADAEYIPNLPKDVEIFRLEGDLFFGAADQFRSTISQIGSYPKVLILEMTHVLNLDATALHALEDVHGVLTKHGTRLILCGVHSQPILVMQRAGFLERVGDANTFGSIKEALVTL